MREQPEQQAPPVQRLRIRYAKRGRLRFASHRDFARAFERAISRARIPVAYSSGFHPHPRISYAGAAPTGTASEAEYLEIGMAEVVDPDVVRVALVDSLPQGLDVLEVVESGGGSLADLLTGSRWTMAVPGDSASWSDHLSAFLAAEQVLVQRMTKKGLREFDCRSAVVSLGLVDGSGGPVLELVLRHVVPAVRPDDVLAGLEIVGHTSSALGDHALMTRLEQGLLDERTGRIADPLRAGS